MHYYTNQYKATHLVKKLKKYLAKFDITTVRVEQHMYISYYKSFVFRGLFPADLDQIRNRAVNMKTTQS